MGIIRRLREWRETIDGTLTGPAIETDSATVNGTTTTDTLEADQAKLVMSDGVSPLSAQSVTISDDDIATFDAIESHIYFIFGRDDFAGSVCVLTNYEDARLLGGINASNESNTELKGTTGPDGSLNVSVGSGVSGDQDFDQRKALMVENRTGGERTYTVISFSEA